MRNIRHVMVATTVFAVFALAGNAQSASEEIWKVPVKFKDGTNENVLYIGGSVGSTDGYDPLEEMDAYFGGNMTSYFYHPEWGRSTDYYMADIRSINYPQEWTLYVQDNLTGDVDVTWNLYHARQAMVCRGLELIFIDPATGQSLQMTDGASYTYYNDASTSTTMSFTITAMQTAPVEKLPGPENLGTNPGHGTVNLHWDDGVQGAVGYQVYRGVEGSATQSLISGDNPVIDDDGDGEVIFRDKSFTKGKKGESSVYIYAVAGVDNNGCTGERATVNVTR